MKYSKAIVTKLVECLEAGATIETACGCVGINPATFYNWQNKKVDFLDTIKKAKAIPDREVETALYRSARGYTFTEETQNSKGNTVRKVTKEVQPNPTSIIFWLKNRKPEEWRDKQEVEHSGSVTTVHDIDENEKKAAQAAIETYLKVSKNGASGKKG